MLLRWIDSSHEPIAVEFGADTGIGWLRLQFYALDAAHHIACAVSVTRGGQSRDARPEEAWRLSIELPTELGLVERFARRCIALGESFVGEARLQADPPTSS